MISAFEDAVRNRKDPFKILNELKRMAAYHFDISIDNISNEDTLFDLGADSLEEIEFVMEIEKRYGISIPDKNLRHIKSIEHFANYIYDIVR